MPEPVCDNCGRDDEDLGVVHRVYVVPEAWDTPGSTTRLPDAEQWCFACRSMYPHDPLGSEGDAAGADAG